MTWDSVCCLLHAVDDASSKVYLKSAKSENTKDVLITLREYVEENGIYHIRYTQTDIQYITQKKSKQIF